MLHRVVRPFPCSFDGLTLIDLNAGDERDFGTMAAGLTDAGFIEPISEASDAPKSDSDDAGDEPAVAHNSGNARGRRRK